MFFMRSSQKISSSVIITIQISLIMLVFTGAQLREAGKKCGITHWCPVLTTKRNLMAISLFGKKEGSCLSFSPDLLENINTHSILYPLIHDKVMYAIAISSATVTS